MRDEHNLELSSVKFVPNDDLVSVPFECGAGLGYKEL